MRAYLSSREACARLEVKAATLYTYVSRGWLEPIPGPDGRQKRYPRSQVEALAARREARAGHGPAAAAAMSWGQAILTTTISAIDPRRGPLYRGAAALELAEAGGSFEEVAEGLWGAGEEEVAARPWPALTQAPAVEAGLAGLRGEGADIFSRAAIGLAQLAAADADRAGAAAVAERERARGLIGALARWLALPQRPRRMAAAGEAGTVAEAMAAALGARRPLSARALNAALILCADHELNASTFAARVVASAGADLYAALLAAIGALSGPRHGGLTLRVEALARRLDHPREVSPTLRELRRRGELIPGFGHPLYPEGDPRAAWLLTCAREHGGRRPRLRALLEFAERLADEGHPPAALDYGLVSLCEALALPTGAAAGVFLVGRAAGWVAHILEQREDPRLIRPRACARGEA